MVQQLAVRLGVSDRHVRRLFEARFGVSPVQYLQTRRLLTAKQLLADTDLAVTQVALISGYASVRRFNAAFLEHYGLNPTQLRREGSARPGQGIAVKLGYRPPYDVDAMLGFFARRAINGIEFIADDAHGKRIGRTFSIESDGKTHSGWLLAEFDEARSHVVLLVSDSLCEVLPLAIRRLRAALDLDADPRAVNSALHASFPEGDGLRVPGSIDGYELALRAVLGQRITVAAARTLAQRIVDRFGEPIATPVAELTRLFPAPAVLAQASGDALGQLAIVKQRQAAIVAIRRPCARSGCSCMAAPMCMRLWWHSRSCPGSATGHIAMRALHWPDAFPAGDVALHKALGVQDAKQPAREAEAASLAWKPWRSYAVIRAWSALPTSNTTKNIAVHARPAKAKR